MHRLHQRASNALCTSYSAHTLFPRSTRVIKDSALPDSIAFHVILALFLIELTLFFRSGILILLVFTHKVIHVGLGFGEFHLVHTLTSVPVKECLAAEHGCEELSHTLEHLLDRSGVVQESHCHLQTLWWDIADTRFDVVRDPLDEVGAVLVLNVEHLLVHFLGRHASTEQRSCSQVAAMTRICGAHHVLSVEHLLC